MSGIGWMRAVVIDARDHEALAEFWRVLLDVEVAERQQGWVQLTPDRGGVYLAFQPAPDGELATGFRARPDIEVDDVEAAKARVVELGGREMRVVRELTGDTHVVMADPEGNEFCILLPLPPELARRR